MNNKKYWHREDVYILYDENGRRFGLIGYSQIAHEDNPDIKFVIYKAYLKPLWSADFILYSKGELRWDGFMMGLQTPTVHLNGIDDLISSISLQYAIYEIAKAEVYLEDIKDKYKQTGLYTTLTGVYEVAIDYLHFDTEEQNLPDKIQVFCDNLKKELTEMSQKSISAMINGDKEGDLEI